MDLDLRTLLDTLPPTSRDKLRRVLVVDHADRDAVASRQLRFGDEVGDDWADVIDFLTLRRDVVRTLPEIDANH